MSELNENLYSNVNEDTVQCLLFPINNQLDVLCDSINRSIENLSSGYIWHRDECRVFQPVKNDLHDSLPCLISTTCFGDNIEDEWFIVNLMLQLTYIDKDIVVQVKDNDGDFLLIEAAEYLPSWATPNNTENRVFIYNGHLHIIPPSLVNLETQLNLKDAINIVRYCTKQTQVSSQIQQVILDRIGKYPEKIEESFHRAVVKLPLEIATLLTLEPSFIAPIVTTYCSHDVIDAKSCKNINFQELFDVKVKFTKCLYAMLKHSTLLNSVRYSNLTRNDKRSILGLKLTCGYKMIMKRSTDIFSSKEYNKFLESLKSNGYFKDNIEGSKQHKDLLEKAKQFFLINECPINTKVCDSMSKVISTEEFNKTKESLKSRQISGEELQDDSEEWLNIKPEQLNDFLNSRYGKAAKFKNNDFISAQTITSELSNFLKQTSDFEGIEMNKDVDTDNIDFNSEEFIDSLQKMMKIVNGETDQMDEITDISDSDDLEDSGIDTTDMALSKELNEKLQGMATDVQNNKSIMNDFVQSIKEEAAFSGPSSNLMRSIGYNKTDILDSDDEQDVE